MMSGVLRAAVVGVAAPCKRDDARAAYLSSVDELDQALDDYRAGRVRLGILRTQLAMYLFRRGALTRSRAVATRCIDALRAKLEREAEQPL